MTLAVRPRTARDRAELYSAARLRGERPGTLLATFEPGSPACSCPSCPDATHGGELGNADTWTWH